MIQGESIILAGWLCFVVHLVCLTYGLVLSCFFFFQILYTQIRKQKVFNLIVLRNINLSWLFEKEHITSQLTVTCSQFTIETLKKVWNMFKVNYKKTRTTSWRRSGVLFSRYFTPFFSVSIVDFEQVTVSWDKLLRLFFEVKMFAINSF